jgi:hypothetical protein
MEPESTPKVEPKTFTRFVKGVVPLAIVGFLFLLTAKDSDPVTGVIMLALSGVVLWFGWTSVSQSRGTRWFGILVAVYIASSFGIFAMALVIRVGLLLFPVLLIAVPLIVYDLLFRAPTKAASSALAPSAASEAYNPVRSHDSCIARRSEVSFPYAPSHQNLRSLRRGIRTQAREAWIRQSMPRLQ